MKITTGDSAATKVLTITGLDDNAVKEALL